MGEEQAEEILQAPGKNNLVWGERRTAPRGCGYDGVAQAVVYHVYERMTFPATFLCYRHSPEQEAHPGKFESLAEAQAACNRHHLTGKWDD